MLAATRANPSVADRDVTDIVDIVGGIDHMATSQE
jgi:hypothetical protein